MSDEAYFLNTKRLGFRRWQDADSALAGQLWGDPAVTRLFSKEPLTADAVVARLQHEIDQEEQFGIQYWPMFNREDDSFVGCCGLRPYGNDTECAEIGFHLVPQHWGKGFATEAARGVIDHAFSKLGKTALFAGHHPQNKSSRNALLKLGFIGAAAEFYEPTGLNHPSYFLYRDEKEFSMRLAKPLDCAAIAAVHFLSIGETFKTLVPEYVASRTLDDFERSWAERFDEAVNATSITSVLLRGNQIAGFVSAGPSRDEDTGPEFGCVDRIYLHPAVFERHLGGRLLGWCENNLKERNFQKVKLWVFESNARAVRFYERNGFTLDGASKVEFNSRLVRYEKKL